MIVELVEKSYLQIEELRWDPSRKRLSRKFYRIADQIKPYPAGKIDRRLHARTRLGHRSKLPKIYYYAALLLRNEMMGCVGKASDREALHRQLRKEYPGWAAQTSKNYIRRFGDYRHRFNLGMMYSGHTMPPLYCWFWNANGYIQHAQAKNQYLSFQHCRRHLRSVQFADPRFFEPVELTELSKDPDWHVPALADIQRIEAEIGVTLYDSISWPQGYSKEFNPI